LTPFGRPGILVTTACKHRIQWGYSKFDPYMNILYRNLCQFTARSYDHIVGSPETYDVKSRENNKIWSAGENGV